MIDQTASPGKVKVRFGRGGLILLTIIPLLALSACDSRKKLPDAHAPNNFSALFIRPEERSGPAIVGGAARALGGLTGQVDQISLKDVPWANLQAEVARRRPDAVCIWVDDDAEHLEIAKKLVLSTKVVVTVSSHTPDSTLGFATVVLDSADAGALLGENLYAAVRGKTFAVVHSSDDADSEAAYRALRAQVDEGQMKRLAELDVARGESAAEAARGVLEQYRFTAVVILMRPGDARPSVLQAIGPQTPLAIFSVQPDLWPAIRSGQVRIAAGFVDGEIGQRAMELMIRGLSSGENPKDPARVAPRIVTPETIAEFEKVYAAAAAPRSASQPASP